MSRQNGLLGILVLGLALLVAWAWGVFDGDDTLSDDPTVAEIQREMRQVAELPEEERREAFRGMRGRGDDLTDEQRMELFESSIPMWEPFMRKQLDEFFAKTPEEQRKQIDEEIDRMQEFRRNNPGANGPGNGRGGPQMSPDQMDEFMKRMVAHLSPDVRAGFEIRINMFNDRLKERGLPPIGPPGR